MTTLSEFYSAWNHAKGGSQHAWLLPDLGHHADHVARFEMTIVGETSLTIESTATGADDEFVVVRAALTGVERADMSEEERDFNMEAALALIGAASPEQPRTARPTVLAKLLQDPGHPILIGKVTYTLAGTEDPDGGTGIGAMTATFA